MEHTNALINSSSPYLIQHAHNPVNWHPWDEAVLKQAQEENKLILVSIGYAACHWCHVMEHESFEDEQVADVMNKHFVCIKVDREERPDVDHYFMSAVQIMGRQGGWPLNVVALPDGRPIWGGTYFPKETWMASLLAVYEYYLKEPAKTENYASQIQDGIESISLEIEAEEESTLDKSLLQKGVENWKSRFDMKNGGSNGAPKFPLPVNIDFLMHYAHLKQDDEVQQFVKVTLEKLAQGGIYDHVGGGFARYSVDEKWKVPHFEKMLYDNGQLLSIYSKAYQKFKTQDFKCLVYETVHFIEREMLDSTGAFFSSLDADSEGEEGKFYVWTENELKKLLEDDYDLFSVYFNVNTTGYWERGNYILLRDKLEKEFAKQQEIEPDELHIKISRWKYKLLKAREKRIRPGLDDKTLTSWNALVIQGLIDAYKAFNDEQFLQLAEKNAKFLVAEQLRENGKIFHSWKNGSPSINGFLEDYALSIQAFLSLFEISGEQDWLKHAIALTDVVFDQFYDERTGMFYFFEKDRETVLSNHFQKEDNVIPSANSVMANNLHRLYLIMGKPSYLKLVKDMLRNITLHFVKYPMAYANWGKLMLALTEPFHELVICGINSNLLLRNMISEYRPNTLIAHCQKPSEIPLLKDRFQLDKDLIYVCRDGACQLPVHTEEEAMKLLQA